MNQTKTTSVNVSLGDRSYPVHIGQDLLGRGDLMLPALVGDQVAIITNTTIASLEGGCYLESVRGCFANQKVDVYDQLPDGEQHKSFANYQAILDFLMQRRHNRSTTLVALGGGVVGDLTGFVAATFQRGVGFVQIPTTLLAQVDSSVGGKTAINHPAGKNMVGAFYQPSAVLADIDVLNTLPLREYTAGLAEVIKYGVIEDPDFFAWCEANSAALAERDPQALIHAVKRSVEVKAAVVAEDEREQGRRAILNYGHTFGHAVEMLTGYTRYLHGEAVALGMVAAAQLSAVQGRVTPDVVERLIDLLKAVGLPVAFPADLSEDAVLDAMGMDKKVLDGRQRFIVADSIGSVQVDDAVTSMQLRSAIAQAVLSK